MNVCNTKTDNTQDINKIPRYLLWLGVGLSALFSVSAYAQDKNDPILAKWLIVGKENMQKRAVIEGRIDQKTGRYYFVIAENIKGSTGYKEYCTGCPAPFTDKKLQGMVMGWNLTRSKTNPKLYVGGYGIDPWSTKMFQVTGQIAGGDNNLIRIRATPLATKLVSRQLVWRRVD